jgi:hypothetical protein
LSIEHKDIPDANLHEPKGVVTAASGTAYIADGSTSGAWEIPKIEGQVTALTDYLPHSDGSGGITWKAPEVLAINELRAEDFTSQNPVGLDNPLQIKFGAGASNDDVTIAADGSITFNTTGTYFLELYGRFGRTTSAGVAILLARYLLNGVQVGNTLASKLSDGDFTVPVRVSTLVTLPAGSVLTVEVMKDSAGIDNGGLEPLTPVDPTWGKSPSASIILTRLVV